MKGFILIPLLLISTSAYAAETQIIKVSGYDYWAQFPDTLEDIKKSINKAKRNAIESCRLLDGIQRSREIAYLNGALASTDASLDCEVKIPKKMPLLGMSAVFGYYNDDVDHVSATNLTQNGREALVKLTKDKDSKDYKSEACLKEAIASIKEIAKDKDLQELKSELERKIGPFSLVYTLSLGRKPEQGKAAEGYIEVFTFDEDKIVDKTQNMNANQLSYNLRWNIHGQHAVTTDSIECRVKQESVRTYLDHMKQILFTPADHLRVFEEEEQSAIESGQ